MSSSSRPQPGAAALPYARDVEAHRGGEVLLRVEIEVDRATIARRHARRARRAPRRSDKWWSLGIGLFGILGWIVSGPSLLWWLCLVAAGLFLVGDALERRAVTRDLRAIPEDQRRRVVTVTEDGIGVASASGGEIVSGPWREVHVVRREGPFYTIVLHGEPVEIPLEALGSELARGSFEAVCARNDRPVQHG